MLDRHPYDLSGGEQQRLALAKVLLLRPRILLMDEPTKGMDAEYKEEIGKILGIPVVANLVKRVHYTGYQKKLDPIGRKKNLEHAFAPGGDPDRLPTDFRRVIIIDDIYTTGNTVDQVAKVLKTMGFQKVYFLTISIGQGY